MYFEGSRGSFLYIKPVASSKDPQEFRFHKHQGPDNNVACYTNKSERVVQGFVRFVQRKQFSTHLSRQCLRTTNKIIQHCQI